MRITKSASLVLAFWVGTAAANSQTFPYEATVSMAEVDVRSLPSSKDVSYPTSKLRQGAVVTVVGEKDGGWLAIKPPSGSFSWIGSKLLKTEQEPYGIVQEDGIEVRIGSSLVPTKPNVRQVRMNRGEKVVLLKERPQTDDDGSVWVMIQPPVNEVRYIPKDAVRATTLATAEPPTGGTPFPAGGPPNPSATATGDPLWVEAEKAEREGRLLDAEKSYTQLAKQTNDNDLKILCHNRVHMIHQANRRGTPGYQPAPNAGNRLVPATASRPLNGGVQPARAASQYTYARETPGGAASPAAPNFASAPQPRGPGLLAPSSVRVFQQQAYLFDMGAGKGVMYVLPQPGISLEPFVGRSVSVTGPIDYHPGFRRHVMLANQVTPQ